MRCQGPVDPSIVFEMLESRQLLNADLIASGITAFPQIVGIGNEFSVTATFRNGGADTTGPFGIEIRLSRDRVWGNEDDIVAGALQRGGGLNGFEIETQTESFLVPSGADASWYYIGMEVDAGNAVLESSEANNRVFSGARLVRIEGVVGGEIEVRGDSRVIFDGDLDPGFSDLTAFGPVRIAGTFREHVFNITNQGDDDLVILGVAFTGRNIADFQIVGDPSGTIAPGASALLRIRFDPSTIGGKRAIVNIFSSDLDEARYTFAIVGRGVRGPGIGRPEIAVTGSLPIFDDDFTPRPEDGTDFGVTTVGQTIERTFYITNIGGGLLRLDASAIRVGGRNPLRFTVVDMPDDATLSAGQTTSFTIRFTALTPGSKRANVQILSNDLDESSFAFQIRGRGHP